MCSRGRAFRAVVVIFLALAPCGAVAEDRPWTELSGDRGLAAWRQPTGDWQTAGAVEVDGRRPTRLAIHPGRGVLVNGAAGKTNDLLSREEFGDVEVHAEFLIPKGSNSGVKLQGLYEIQILDSFGVRRPKGSDCGGIYPRAELTPRYHHIDDGVPPRVNAARPAGQWQSLDIVFQAPRFGADGKKTANARFVRVVLNDRVIHENVEVATPTGHAWRLKEVARGPLLLQGDHGAVAFRNVRVRSYRPKSER